jgi:hypothetical protein
MGKKIPLPVKFLSSTRHTELHFLAITLTNDSPTGLWRFALGGLVFWGNTPNVFINKNVFPSI